MKASSLFRSRRRTTTVLAVILFFLPIVFYFPSFDFPLIGLDDHAYLIENPYVGQGITPLGIRWAFTTFHSANWHPITWLSHMVDVEIFGHNPGGYHAMNTLLHAVNTLLIFLLLTALTGAPWKSAAVAALFAAHPVNVESVAWIAERKNVLSTTFGLLTMAVYVRYARRPSLIRYLPVMTLFALGLAAKPMLVTIPFLLLLLDLWPLGRLAYPLPRPVPLLPFWDKVPLLALSAASSIVTLAAQTEAITILPLKVRLANAVFASLLYFKRMFVPVGLAIFYPHGGIPPFLLLAFALLVVTGLLALAVLSLRNRPAIGVGLFWFFGTLVPVIGIVQVGIQSSADRYMYLPGIGLFIAAIWGAGEIMGRYFKRTVVPLAALTAVVAAFSTITGSYLSLWKEPAALFRHAIAVTKDNWIAQGLLADTLFYNDEVDEALNHYRESFRIAPLRNPFLENYGLALKKADRLNDAIVLYSATIRKEPTDVKAYYSFGDLLENVGRLREAEKLYKDALRIDPSFAPAKHGLGRVKAQTNRRGEAIKHFSEALALSPDSWKISYNLAKALAEEGRTGEAVAVYRKTLAMAPDDTQTLVNLGILLAETGEQSEAMNLFRKVLGLDPNSAQAHYNLGLGLDTTGDKVGAETHYRAAIAIDPMLTDAYLNLGALLAERGDFAEAAGLFREVLKQSPGDPEATANLARIEALLESPKPAPPSLR